MKQTGLRLPFLALLVISVTTMSSKSSPPPQFPVMSDATTDSQDLALCDSFSHLVEQGWKSECAESTEFGGGHSPVLDGFDPSGAVPSTGLFGDDVAEYPQQSSFEEFAGDVEQNLGGDPLSHFDSLLDGSSVSSGQQSTLIGARFGVDPVVPNIAACVDAAYAMIPVEPPKPVWEQGVWADIFGDGVFLKHSWTSVGLKKLPLPFAPATSDAATGTDHKRAKRLKVSDDGFTHEDIVINKTDQTWQEERESLVQCALKRWLVVSSYFQAKTVIRTQLDGEPTELGKLTLLADVFRGRAPATLLKRVRSVEKMCSAFGMGNFPPDEPAVYKFLTAERNSGAPPSRLKGCLEALSFCRHVLSMDQLGQVVQSRRCIGATTAEVPGVVAQAAPLKVEELKTLHLRLLTGDTWDKIFVGAILFAVYSRARWSDLMHCTEVILDRDHNNVLRFIEGHTASHKTMRAEMFKHQFVPLTAPAFGVTDECWPELWLESRHSAGVMLPPFHTTMPAPDSDGNPAQRPLTSNEASQWLRKLLTGEKKVDVHRKISVHSCKVTCLSFCAKYEIDAMTRLQLGYHSGGGSGLRMVHTYSRDAASEPLARLIQVLDDIRAAKFLPDSTRSGRFAQGSSASASGQKVPMPSGRVEPNPVEWVDLVSNKSESESDDEVATSSSDESSQEEFQEEQKRYKVYLPPEPPAGYVFWQHSRMKTLHLALPEYKRVFMCNRPIGPLHTQCNMSIRYDTPVCRQCVSATSPKGEAGVNG